MTINNDLIKEGDIVWLRVITHSWTSKGVAKIIKATVVKRTPTRIVVAEEGHATQIKFEYRKTIRLSQGDSFGTTTYWLYRSREELVEMHENIKHREKLRTVCEKKIKRADTAQLEQIYKILENIQED